MAFCTPFLLAHTPGGWGCFVPRLPQKCCSLCFFFFFISYFFLFFSVLSRPSFISHHADLRISQFLLEAEEQIIPRLDLFWVSLFSIHGFLTVGTKTFLKATVRLARQTFGLFTAQCHSQYYYVLGFWKYRRSLCFVRECCSWAAGPPFPQDSHLPQEKICTDAIVWFELEMLWLLLLIETVFTVAAFDECPIRQEHNDEIKTYFCSFWNISKGLCYSRFIVAIKIISLFTWYWTG